MTLFADTPTPPYYAVIFTSVQTDDTKDYAEKAQRMLELAEDQPGYLGVESAHQQVGITISYWSDLESIRRWRANSEHKEAQRLGKDKWYAAYRVRVARVETEYGM